MGDLVVGILVAVLGLFLLAVAVGWALGTLLRVRRLWAVALLGLVVGFGLAVAGTVIVHVNLFPVSPWSVFAAAIAYELVGLLRNSSAEVDQGQLA
ncbi:hypothetical protein [Actinocrispum wychmicini]|uniref:Uncharacterized protein n=1 Tax=Actinocrispum wychmicini TaxID=1213861 RepID=A0A4R2JCH9_9PSEU|nr:hypothetical protein [Actinocrispum wychmicini]TCO55722.1 hypothetical protein EV192_107145 [Actinocrispum wychmicini]